MLKLHPVDAFVAASVSVLGKLTRTTPRAGAPRTEPWHSCAPCFFLVNIGLRGGLHGQVVFGFERALVDTLVELAGSCCEDSEMMCEVANMIAGNALGVLEAAGYRATITPPEVLGHDQSLPDDVARPVVVVPLQSGHGEIGVCMFIEDPVQAGARPVC